MDETKEMTKEQKLAEKEAKKQAKAEAKLNKPKKQRISVAESYDKLQLSMPVLFLTCLASVVVMFMICAGVFFANVKGAEQVLVPNVVGKTLEDGIIEMQIKELYPKVSLRFSDEVTEKGIILEQSPEAGAIVKGYSTVTLVVSRGEENEEVPDLVGKLIDSVNSEESDKKKALINLANPSYIIDTAPAGTIIAQFPSPGTVVYEKTALNLVVSKGASKETVQVPEVKGVEVSELISLMGSSNLIFDVTYHKPGENEIAGTVVSQSVNPDQTKEKYSRVNVEMALDDNTDNLVVSGVFQKTLSDYPVPVIMSLEALTPEGKMIDVAKFKHIGGNVTVPYSVPKGSTLIFSVLGDEKARTIIG